MNLQLTDSGVYLIRETGDKALSHESNVTHHIRRLLNIQAGKRQWVRCYPDKIGLTACRQGVRSLDNDTVFWHERYQIEAAHKTFNLCGKVFFLKASK